MADIVILGAGLGGIPTALEMKNQARSEDRVIVVNKMDKYTFIPSNPWVAVGWRKPEQVEVPLVKMFAKRGIDFIATAAEKVIPEEAWSSRGNTFISARSLLRNIFSTRCAVAKTNRFMKNIS